MIEIDNTIVHTDIFTQPFKCNLKECKGQCCIEGDSGAPLTDEEIVLIANNLDNIYPYLRKESINTIKISNFYYVDNDGDKVTQLNNQKECVFVYFENQIARCAIEKAYEDQKITFQKPISCSLYPIRLTSYKQFIAVNYHSWDICKPAIEHGKEHNTRIIDLCKSALVRYFGQSWFEKAEEVAKYLQKNDISLDKR